jgi:formylglycine-generating enzyme required for sulfatase activity
MEQRTLGDYRIIKSIGQGTLGAVYLAEHRFMKRQYVLKVLPEELSSDRSFIQRFEEDVGVLASLDHPNIVKIYNISFAQGQYFLVTDCIVDAHGETTNLAQYVMGLRRSLEEDELFHILRQVADPLDYAHAKKSGSKEFVHRCLKLNNILVGKSKQGIDIYLSDFGLSRIIGSGAVLTRTYKNIAEALGIGLHLVTQKAAQDRYPNPPIEQQKLTPLHTSFLQNYAFLAPEQKRLDSVYTVDAKVDVYAFGVLVYFLLMNELPEGLFDMPSSRGQYRYQWDHLIRSCLQNNPIKRPDHLLSLLEAIRPEKAFLVLEEPKKVLATIHQKIVDEETPAEIAIKYAAFEHIEKPAVQLKPVLVNALEVEAYPTIPLEDHLPPSVEEKTRPVDASSNLKPSLQMPQLERPQTDLDPGAIFQVNSSVKTYNPERKDVTNVKPLLTDMVIIPGRTFYRGSHDGNRDEMPRHQITLSSFAIDIHPITNEQFVRFLEVMGGEKDSNHNDIIRLRDSRIKRSGGKLSIESGYAKHPVVGVTWYGAIAYAKWIGKRLPTEAEWEIAARGEHEHSLYPTGDDIEKTQANFFSSDTTAVMSYAPNNYGLYDVSGNVYEWCHDWYGYNYYEVSAQEPENPQGPLQGVYRVLRGGCWKSLKEDLRCSRRHRNNPGTVNGTYGFRCAAGVQNF